MIKFLIDLGNAQWIDGSGIDEKQEAFDIYEHLISTTKADDAEPDSSVGKPDTERAAGWTSHIPFLQQWWGFKYSWLLNAKAPAKKTEIEEQVVKRI